MLDRVLFGGPTIMRISQGKAVLLLQVCLLFLAAMPPASWQVTGFFYAPPTLIYKKATCECWVRVPTQRGQSVVCMGLLDGLKKAIGTAPEEGLQLSNEKVLGAYQLQVQRVNDLEEVIERLSDSELRSKTEELRGRIQGKGEIDSSTVEEAFAVVREAAWRVLEMRHYDVQLMGGLALNEGRLAEMATGEGKTLVATLPAYVNALNGQGAFVVTANDYLARRDAEIMGQVHRFLGLSVGLIQAGMNFTERREAYGCDVVYVTNVELGFDYLRDNLALSREEVVLTRRPLKDAYCLVDEADSILIDEARTPLIISKQVAAPQPKYGAAKKLVEYLKKGVHYEVDEKAQNVILTDQGIQDCERLLGKGLFDIMDPWMSFITNALKAKELLVKDKDYIIRGEDVAIVDRFSGRVLEGRKYSDGLQQSIQVKEGLSCSSQSQVIATITYQSLFGQFGKLSGMTGTAMTDYKDFISTYNLEVISIPTALPNARRDYPDVIFRTKDGKLRAVLREVRRAHKAGQPILIGTTSVETSELVADTLDELGIRCRVLNARPDNVERESEVVAQAGRLGAVTVATNMAGRGTDILLGGNPALMARIKIRESMAKRFGMYDVRDIDDDFFPCDLSNEAEALLDNAIKACEEWVKKEELTRYQVEELISVAAENSPLNNEVVLALREAFDEIKRLYREALSEEKEEVKRVGGLYVIGTERHESRRIDNQLRGRAGRQGDPGATRFFLSIDDDIFRIFGADKVKSVLDAFRIGEDLPIESKAVTETLDKVQQQVESYYYDIRQKLLAFDSVISKQRFAIYNLRRQVLEKNESELDALMKEFARQTSDDIVNANFDTEKRPKIVERLRQFFPNLSPVEQQDVLKMSKQQLSALLHSLVERAVDAKKAELIRQQPGLYRETVRYLTLLQYDNLWAQQLEALEQLKEVSVLQRFKGADPMQEYQRRTETLLQDVLGNVRRNTVYSVMMYNPASPVAKT